MTHGSDSALPDDPLAPIQETAPVPIDDATAADPGDVVADAADPLALEQTDADSDQPQLEHDSSAVESADADSPAADVPAADVAAAPALAAPSLPVPVSTAPKAAGPIATTFENDGLVLIPHPSYRSQAGKELPPALDYSQPPPQPELDPLPAEPVLPPTRGSGYTLPMLCSGLAIIACCVLIPLADQNRQLVWQRERLKLDLEQIKRQVAINDEFLHKLDDTTLAERLAQRQMRKIRAGTGILPLDDQDDSTDTSPFLLVTVPPPAELPPYEPIGGIFTRFCQDSKRRLYTMGVGLLLVAAGIILGSSPRSPARIAGVTDGDDGADADD